MEKSVTSLDWSQDLPLIPIPISKIAEGPPVEDSLNLEPELRVVPLAFGKAGVPVEDTSSLVAGESVPIPTFWSSSMVTARAPEPPVLNCNCLVLLPKIDPKNPLLAFVKDKYGDLSVTALIVIPFPPSGTLLSCILPLNVLRPIAFCVIVPSKVESLVEKVIGPSPTVAAVVDVLVNLTTFWVVPPPLTLPFDNAYLPSKSTVTGFWFCTVAVKTPSPVLKAKPVKKSLSLSFCAAIVTLLELSVNVILLPFTSFTILVAALESVSIKSTSFVDWALVYVYVVSLPEPVKVIVFPLCAAVINVPSPNIFTVPPLSLSNIPESVLFDPVPVIVCASCVSVQGTLTISWSSVFLVTPYVLSVTSDCALAAGVVLLLYLILPNPKVEVVIELYSVLTLLHVIWLSEFLVIVTFEPPVNSTSSVMKELSISLKLGLILPTDPAIVIDAFALPPVITILLSPIT